MMEPQFLCLTCVHGGYSDGRYLCYRYPKKVTFGIKSSGDGLNVFGCSYLAVECSSYNAKVDKKVKITRATNISVTVKVGGNSFIVVGDQDSLNVMQQVFKKAGYSIEND